MGGERIGRWEMRDGGREQARERIGRWEMRDGGREQAGEEAGIKRRTTSPNGSLHESGARRQMSGSPVREGEVVHCGI